MVSVLIISEFAIGAQVKQINYEHRQKNVKLKKAIE